MDRSPDNTGLDSDPSGQGMELAEILAASTAWGQAREQIRISVHSDSTHDEVIGVCLAAIREAGLDGETALADMPEEYADRVTLGERGAFVEAFNLYMAASLISDLTTGKPLPFVSLARGYVRTETHEADGLVYPVVLAMATPLDDPDVIVARFAEACYQTFDSGTFAKRTANVRDAGWWRRHAEGESFRSIALSDPRSGLAPEAALEPKEYASEVTRATDTVRRAVKRFTTHWTHKAEVLSKEPL